MVELEPTRRRVLTTAATAGAAALAGCGGSGSGGSGGGSTAAFETVEIDGDQLIVQIASDAVSQVNVIGPSGEPSLGSASVAAGATQVSFNLMQTYEPGEHTVVAVDGEGGEIGSVSQRLEPDVKLKRVITWSMDGKEDWEMTAYTPENPILELENTGNVPAQLSYVYLDNVPNPTIGRDYKSNQESVSGLQDKDQESITRVNAGETVTGVVTGSPLGFVSDSNVECPSTTVATITIGHHGVETQISVPIEYTVTQEDTALAGNQKECSATVLQQP